MASHGAKLTSFNKRMTEGLEGGVYTHDAPTPDGAMSTGAFPRGGLQARDPRDELISEKHQMMDANGMTEFGQVQATDRDFEWLRKKRETEAFANLDAWVGENFHTSDVATRKWLQETYPEYYEARERLMVDRAKLALRIKLLKLRGPKNEKDLMLIWGLQTGRVKLDRDWDRIGPYQERGQFNRAGEQERYKNGLFSIRRYVSGSERADNAGYDAGGSSPNPFMPKDPGSASMAQFQTDEQKFPGSRVPFDNRYPAFLNDTLRNYL